MRAYALPTLVLLALATACGGVSEPAAPGAPASTGPGGSVAAALKDFAITATPLTVRSGAVTFAVTNAGPGTHALAIDGPGFAGAATGSLAPGVSSTLSVVLPAGTYHLYCPIGGHRSLGMDTTITVSGGAGATAPTSGSTSGHAWS